MDNTHVLVQLETVLKQQLIELLGRVITANALEEVNAVDCNRRHPCERGRRTALCLEQPSL